MNGFYSGLKFSAFFVALLVLVFFLKVICPLEVGCLPDPFILIFFSPLLILDSFAFLNVSMTAEPLFILIFWAFVGWIFGFLFSDLFSGSREKESRLPPRESFK